MMVPANVESLGWDKIMPTFSTSANCSSRGVTSKHRENHVIHGESHCYMWEVTRDHISCNRRSLKITEALGHSDTQLWGFWGCLITGTLYFQFLLWHWGTFPGDFGRCVIFARRSSTSSSPFFCAENKCVWTWTWARHTVKLGAKYHFTWETKWSVSLFCHILP